MTTSLNDSHKQNDPQQQSDMEVVTQFEDDHGQQTNLPHPPKKESEPSQRKLLMWLMVSSPDEQRGTVLPVAHDSIIGRHGDITWHDSRMSRKHARFVLMDDPQNQGQQIFGIIPVKDRNGTVVNGRRITALTIIRENDVLLMGSTQFVVKVLT